MIQLKDEKTSAPKQVLLDGRPATTFTRDTFEFLPPETIDAERIPLRAEYYVVPHKQGFVVLTYKAPTIAFHRWRPALQHLLNTFRLLPEHIVVTLRAAVPGWEAEEIEMAVARPLETCLSGLDGLVEIRSASYRGECTIWLKLQHGADVAASIQEMQRSIAQAQDELPAAAACTLKPVAGDERQRALIAVCSTDESRPREKVLTELETLTDRVVRDRLQIVPGVASVTVGGGGQRYEIVPLPERLAAHDVGVQELLDVARKLGGDEAAPQLNVGIEASLEDVRRTIVAVRSGKSITVGDLARVRLGRAHGAASRLWLADDAGQVRSPAAVLLAVESLTNADAGAVYRAVDAVLSEIRAMLPAGVTLQRRLFTAADIGAVVATPADDGPRNLNETIDQSAGKLLRLPGVRSVWRLDLPGNAVSFDGHERAMLLIEVKSGLSGNRRELLDGIRAAFAPMRSLASLGTAVAEPGQFPGVLAEVTAVLTGSDLEVMRREAEGVRERFAELPGVADLQLEPPEPGLSLRFKARNEDTKRYGLDAADALKLAQAVAYRLPLTRISGPAGRPIDVVMMLESSDPAELAQVILSTPEGMRVPLDRVVDILATDVPQIIFRQNGRRATIIACNARNHDPAATRESLKKLCRTLLLPESYSLRCGED